MFYLVDGVGVAPLNSRLIENSAKEYYDASKEKFNINLDNVPGDKITLEGIMQYIDIKPKYELELSEVDQKLLEVRDNEYLDSLLPIKPMAFGMNSEKEMLIARKMELLKELNNLNE